MHFLDFWIDLRENLLSQFTHFFCRFFKTEKQNPQTYSLLECMGCCCEGNFHLGQRKSLDLNGNNNKIEGDARLWIAKGETDMDILDKIEFFS